MHRCARYAMMQRVFYLLVMMDVSSLDDVHTSHDPDPRTTTSLERWTNQSKEILPALNQDDLQLTVYRCAVQYHLKQLSTRFESIFSRRWMQRLAQILLRCVLAKRLSSLSYPYAPNSFEISVCYFVLLLHWLTIVNAHAYMYTCFRAPVHVMTDVLDLPTALYEYLCNTRKHLWRSYSSIVLSQCRVLQLCSLSHDVTYSRHHRDDAEHRVCFPGLYSRNHRRCKTSHCCVYRSEWSSLSPTLNGCSKMLTELYFQTCAHGLGDKHRTSTWYSISSGGKCWNSIAETEWLSPVGITGDVILTSQLTVARVQMCPRSNLQIRQRLRSSCGLTQALCARALLM